MDYYIAILIPIIIFGIIGLYRVNRAYHIVLANIRADIAKVQYIEAKDLLFRAHMYLIGSTFLAILAALVRLIEIIPK